MKNIPKKIYLNLGLRFKEELPDDFKELHIGQGDVTWCEDKIDDCDIEYRLVKQESKDG